MEFLLVLFATLYLFLCWVALRAAIIGDNPISAMVDAMEALVGVFFALFQVVAAIVPHDKKDKSHERRGYMR